jgi:hypothetical protein
MDWENAIDIDNYENIEEYIEIAKVIYDSTLSFH